MDSSSGNPPPFLIPFGKKMNKVILENLAQRKGYTVKDIQQYLGLSCPQPVYRWYKGVILPSVDNLLRLSELYHVHMEELLVRTGNVLYYDAVQIKKSNFEERIRSYHLKLVA